MTVAIQGDANTHTWDLDLCPEQIPRWRHRVAAVVEEWQAARGAEDTVLLGVTELLTNVLKHVRDPRCTLELRRVGTTVVITVSDRSYDLPRILRPDPAATEGRGLWLVSLLVEGRMGWWVTPTGKKVWCSCGPRPRPEHPR